MGRQSKEESQILWKLELESVKKITLIPEHQKLVDLVTKKIDDYTLTYEEHLADVTNFLKDTEDDEPKEVIKNMCNYLIQKYGSKEVRSEQDQNGLGTIECNGESCEDSDNGR